MVARLTMKKNKSAEYFSTNMTSGWLADTRSSLAAQPMEDEDSNTDINNDSWDDNHSFGRSKTGEI